ncbi:unnamed protein product [Parnassius apollo]|nr:unnamed protein product [Parnassius apollo]
MLPKKDFSKLIGHVWTQVDPSVCAAGFRKASIFPFNNDAVPEHKFHPDQLAEWRKQRLERCTEVIETSIAPDIPKHRDNQQLHGPSCSKDQINHPHQAELSSENNVNIVKVPSLIASCLNYWNRQTKEPTEPNEHQHNHNKLQSIKCKYGAKTLKIVPLNYDIHLHAKSQINSIKRTSPVKIIVQDDRPVQCDITFEELLLQKIKADSSTTKTRTKVADGAELITSEDVYIKQKNEEEKQTKKLNKIKINTKEKNEGNKYTKQFQDTKRKKVTKPKESDQKTKKLKIDEFTSESDMEIELMDESDLENYDLNNILDNDEENDDITAEVEKADCIEYDDPLTSTVVKGQWVLVKFALKTSVKHYVGVVTELNCEGKPTINYVRKSRHRGSEDKLCLFFHKYLTYASSDISDRQILYVNYQIQLQVEEDKYFSKLPFMAITFSSFTFTGCNG